MDSTLPQDLLDLKIRVNHWRTSRRLILEALPKELREAITESLSRHPVRLIKKALKLDPYRFRMASPPVSVRPRERQWIDFVPLPHLSFPVSIEPVHILSNGDSVCVRPLSPEAYFSRGTSLICYDRSRSFC